MADNFVQQGDVVPVIAAAAVVAGQGLQVGALFGVALNSAGIGGTVQLKRTGIFTLPKLSTDDMAAGAKVYWDIADGEITLLPDSATNKLVGFAAEARGAATTTVPVILTGEASV